MARQDISTAVAPETAFKLAEGPHTGYPYDVHTMVRTLGNDSAPRFMEADRDVQAWLDSGFELVSTHYAGDVAQEGARMIYVLRRVRA